MDKYNELQTVLKNKEKVLIIGPNGAGKSTFATELGKHYDFEVCHLDKLFWQENWNAVAKADFEDKVDNIMSSKKKYIIDGDYFFNLEKRLEHADLVIWIKIPLFLCVANIIKRRFKYMTNVRPDVTEGCDEKLNLSFLLYALKYNKRSGKQTKELLDNVYDKELFVIDSYKKLKSCC
ncbi:ATP-binding cassette domain-containing protein [Listeria monocytogenes]|uniref:ATP-binding cassette domain-containing protein n=1 Tax=Listeria monocytogenes TaxID=1639 RepID=A0AAN2YL56_LISMN|nr:ATP-binding cassette domain-containing protein [Listeria monocytogenes]EAF4500293.1 ATP-binding cassette domain-containing protein [Listeria monocytogenes serotype 4b]EAF4546494.1 ATP-binding cassette domain-containing protein [Listeria monocytogenes serotype 1/2a]EAC4838124.1 ATP-binding cassette domain-containing protein [Listeria monocytogenes]EAC7306114.1 ATP-binding cassette domain-containing protein [Listeria monocytogenes]EAC8474965.1 ATP-binding cassette domain-containing protein [L